MNNSRVLEEFKVLSRLSDFEAAEHTALCRACEQKIESMLKAGTDRTAHGDELVTAAAALAYYRYTLASVAGDSGEYFAAGDVKVSLNTDKACSAAKTLCDEALSAIAYLCEQQDFYFGLMGDDGICAV